jgi:F0F1-type ATP synthase alpha subunit
MDIRAEEISKIIRDQISGYTVEVNVAEVGSVISIGDGIARVHGIERAMAGEMLEFTHGVYGIALNLEERRSGSSRRFQSHQGRRRRQAHRTHHLGPGRRADARARRQRARSAD